jgi:Mg2+ and Co2+ transporter CorA
MKKLSDFTDDQLSKLIDNRWKSSETIWDTIEKVYNTNIKVYKNEPEWLNVIAKKKSRVRANRVFVNMETVINSLIANLPKPMILSGRDTPEAKALSQRQEKYFQIKYTERNIKEIIRKGLRNLYFSRLTVLKPFWNAKINDFDARAIDSRKVRFSKTATKEEDSEFAIEEITDTLSSVLKRFPAKSKEILESVGMDTDEDVLITNPEIKYYEAWCWDYVIFKLCSTNVILGKIRNPYWDWDGILITPEEEKQLAEVEGDERRNMMQGLKALQPEREAYQESKTKAQEAGEMPDLENTTEDITLNAYLFNHFDRPRKPYIFATIFNNENSPIGQTDMITQSAPLQENIDETKRDITQNAKLVNGIIKVDAGVMEKSDAQRMRFETEGIIWGKGAVAGVQRETGPALPAFVVENMQDSRREIDDIMAASSAFKGIREGQETRGGRLALIDQSFLRLNELVQTIDYLNYELFNWFYQLAKVRYTEHHYAKSMGKAAAIEILTLIQDDFQEGAEIRVIAGKTLPEDRQFKYEQAQADVEKGLLSPVDYFEVAGYDAPAEKAKNRVVYDLNKPFAVGIPEEEMAQIAPKPPEEPPKMTMNYVDLPPDGKVQFAAKAGIELNPEIVVAEEIAKREDAKATERNQNDLANRSLEMKAKEPKAKPKKK